MKPSLSFFEYLRLVDSQDGNGIFDTIKATIEKHNILLLLEKLIFLSCDGASVNSGKKSGLVSLFVNRMSGSLSYGVSVIALNWL